MKEFVLNQLLTLNSFTLSQLIRELGVFYGDLLLDSTTYFSSLYMPNKFDEYVRNLSIEEVAGLIKDILDWVHNKVNV